MFTDLVVVAGQAGFAVVLVGCVIFEYIAVSRPHLTEFRLGTAAGRAALIAPRSGTGNMQVSGILLACGVVVLQWLPGQGFAPWVRWLLPVALAFPLTRSLISWISRTNRITLTADGISLPTLLGSRFVPWTALSPAGLTPGPAHEPLTVRVDDPAQIRLWGLLWTRPSVLRTGSGLVHAGFIAEVIRYYVGHPEHRAAIGTGAELDRLRADLADDAARL